MIDGRAVPLPSSAASPEVEKPYGFLGADSALMNPSIQTIKRVVDILGSSVGLLVGWPLLLVIAVLIRIDSPGPVIYRQLRIGRNGRRFQIWKFRTMHPEIAEYFQSRLESDPGLLHEWVDYQKIRHDPRLTRFGRFIRRYSLDELPQLWNVLCGEMSLVGPRPFSPDQEAAYAEDSQAFEKYVQVRPGLTGLWQVSGRNNTTFRERVTWDSEYFRSWSPWLEMRIYIRTIWVIIYGEGAY